MQVNTYIAIVSREWCHSRQCDAQRIAQAPYWQSIVVIGFEEINIDDDCRADRWRRRRHVFSVQIERLESLLHQQTAWIEAVRDTRHHVLQVVDSYIGCISKCRCRRKHAHQQNDEERGKTFPECHKTSQCYCSRVF